MVHGGNGLLHGEGRVHLRQDVPARCGGERLDPLDPAARHLRVPRLPFRPCCLRLHRGALGQGGVPRLPVRVSQHVRRPGRPRGRALLPDRSGGFRPRLPPLAAQEVPAAAGRDRRAFRFRTAVPRRQGRDPAGPFAGSVAVRRPGGGARRHPRRSRHRPVRHSHAASDRQPDEGLYRRVRVSGGAVPDHRRAHGPRHLLLGRRQLRRRLRQARARPQPDDFRRARAQAREDDRDGGRAADEPGLQPRRPDRRVFRQPGRPVRHLHGRPRDSRGDERHR